VTLLNWGVAGRKAEIKVAVEGKVRRVESVRSGVLPFQQKGGIVTTSLTMDEVDVLKIYTAAATVTAPKPKPQKPVAAKTASRKTTTLKTKTPSSLRR